MMQFARFRFRGLPTTIYCVLIAVGLLPIECKAGNLALSSPDNQYSFCLVSQGDQESYLLKRGDEVLWSTPGQLLDKLECAWSPDSQALLFVQGNRFDLTYLEISSNRVQAHAVDQSEFKDLGQRLIYYNWYATGQGTIPHDLIRNLRTFGSGKFQFDYIRARFPTLATLKCTLDVTHSHGNLLFKFAFANKYLLQNLTTKNTSIEAVTKR